MFEWGEGGNLTKGWKVVLYQTYIFANFWSRLDSRYALLFQKPILGLVHPVSLAGTLTYMQHRPAERIARLYPLQIGFSPVETKTSCKTGVCHLSVEGEVMCLMPKDHQIETEISHAGHWLGTVDDCRCGGVIWSWCSRNSNVFVQVRDNKKHFGCGRMFWIHKSRSGTQIYPWDTCKTNSSKNSFSHAVKKVGLGMFSWC